MHCPCHPTSQTELRAHLPACLPACLPENARSHDALASHKYPLSVFTSLSLSLSLCFFLLVSHLRSPPVCLPRRSLFVVNFTCPCHSSHRAAPLQTYVTATCHRRFSTFVHYCSKLELSTPSVERVSSIACLNEDCLLYSCLTYSFARIAVLRLFRIRIPYSSRSVY